MLTFLINSKYHKNNVFYVVFNFYVLYYICLLLHFFDVYLMFAHWTLKRQLIISVITFRLGLVPIIILQTKKTFLAFMSAYIQNLSARSGIRFEPCWFCLNCSSNQFTLCWVCKFVIVLLNRGINVRDQCDLIIFFLSSFALE